MDGSSEYDSCFFIDLGSGRVFCRSCRGLCKKLVEPDAVRFWCANHDCTNSAEVVISADGEWSVHRVVESWFNEWCGAFSSEVVFSQNAVDRAIEPEDRT